MFLIIVGHNHSNVFAEYTQDPQVIGSNVSTQLLPCFKLVTRRVRYPKTRDILSSWAGVYVWDRMN